MRNSSANLIFIIVLGMVPLFALISSILPLGEQPETEMQALLKIEQGLSLPPEQVRRTESNDGDTDWKGAHHYDSYVTLKYSSSADSKLALQRVLNAQYWRLEYKSGDPADTAGTYNFINRTQRACIHLEINDEPAIKGEFGDTLTNYLNLMGASDSGCRANFAQPPA